MRDPADTTQGLFAAVVGAAIAGAGLYLLSEEISGDLTPLAYFAMIGIGAAVLARGLRVFVRGRDGN
jgi:hypothetical protein